MRIEPVRGSLTVSLVRRALLDARRFVRRGSTHFVLRLGITRPEALCVPPNRKPSCCDKLCDKPVTPKPDPPPQTPIDHPPLELDWPSDRKCNKPEPITIIQRNEPPRQADGFIGGVFDLFV